MSCKRTSALLSDVLVSDKTQVASIHPHSPCLGTLSRQEHGDLCGFASYCVQLDTVHSKTCNTESSKSFPSFSCRNLNRLLGCCHIPLCAAHNQAVQIEAGWKIVQIAACRYSTESLTLWASDGVTSTAGMIPVFQTV